MDVRVLRYFLAAAEAETISAAAQSLHLTQPTLSRQLIALEAELGTPLFLRNGRRSSLTEAGRLLRQRATEIVTLVDKTHQEFVNMENLVAGDVSIGAGETSAMRLVARAAKNLQSQWPHIRYHLHSGNADDVTQRLDKGLLDFGLLIEPVDLQKYDFIRLPSTDTWGVLMHRDSPLACQEVIHPQDLWDKPLLVSRQSLAKRDLANWLGREFEELNVVNTYNLLFNAAVMVEEGFGYAMALDKLANSMEVSHLCFRPLVPPLTVGLALVWKKQQIFSLAAKKFLEHLQACFSRC